MLTPKHAIMGATLLACVSLAFALREAWFKQDEPSSELRELPSEGKLQAMSREEAMAFLLGTYKPQMDNVVADVTRHAPQEHRSELKRAVITYSLEDTPFAFYYDPVESKAINICLGGINVLDISATALAASIVLLNDSGWWTNYMLYHRALRRRPGSVWIDPLYAAGITRDNTPEHKAGELAHFAHRTFGDMVAFVVAHEVAHFALNHSSEQMDGEDEAGYLKRIREQELQADMFALRIVASMEVNPLAAIFALLTHQGVFEEPLSSETATHPTDARRIRNAIHYFNTYQIGDQQESAAARSIADLFSTDVAFEALEELASTISAGSLRVWPESTRSDGEVDRPN